MISGTVLGLGQTLSGACISPQHSLSREQRQSSSSAVASQGPSSVPALFRASFLTDCIMLWVHPHCHASLLSSNFCSKFSSAAIELICLCWNSRYELCIYIYMIFMQFLPQIPVSDWSSTAIEVKTYKVLPSLPPASFIYADQVKAVFVRQDVRWYNLTYHLFDQKV